MTGKKNGISIRTVALDLADARVPSPQVGDRLTDIRLACEACFVRKGMPAGKGMRGQIHVAAVTALEKKKGAGR